MAASITTTPPSPLGLCPKNCPGRKCQGRELSEGKCPEGISGYLPGMEEEKSGHPRGESVSGGCMRTGERILILITAVLYSAPSRKSTQERSQPNLGQTMWS